MLVVLSLVVASFGGAVGPEVPVGGVRSAPATGSQRDGAASFDGVNILAVWSDDRGVLDQDLFFGRVGIAGELRDPRSLPLATGPGNQTQPAVAFGASVHLVAWVDDVAAQGEIRAARVAPSGAVLDAVPLQLTSTLWEESAPAVSFDGQNFLVAWLDARSAPNTEVYGVRISPQGVVLDATPLRLTTTPPGDKQSLAAAFDGTSHVLVWVDGRAGAQTDLYLERIAPDGTPQEPAGFAVDTSAADAAEPKLAAQAGNVVVAWTSQTGLDRDVRVQRLGTGTTLALDGPSVAVQQTAADQFGPAVAVDGADWVVAILNAGTNTRQILPYSAGGVLGSVLVNHQLPYSSDRQELFPIGANLYDVASGNGTVEIYAYVRATGADVFKHELTLSSETQWYPALAATPVGYLLSLMIGGRDLFDPTDATTTVQPFGLDGGPAGADRTLDNAILPPALAGNGSAALVTYSGYWSPTYIAMMRVDSAGNPIDPGPVRLSAGVGEMRLPRVASNGQDWLVAWTSLGGPKALWYARVGADGGSLDPGGIKLFDAAQTVADVDVAFDGTRYLVVWRDDRSGTPTVRATSITTGGVATPVQGFEVAPGGDQYSPAVAAAPGLALVVWEDNRLGTPDIYGARVALDGGLLDPAGFAISTAAGQQVFPRVAWDGARFVVLWEDRRSAQGSQVRGSTVTPAGAVEPEFMVAPQLGSGRPAIASNGIGRSLIAYQRFEVTAPLTSIRSFVRTLCFDGGCCDSACGVPNPDGGAALEPPAFATFPTGAASCSAPWRYAPLVTGAGPIDYRIRSVNGALPGPVFVNSETGEVLWRPGAANVGPAEFDLVATGPGGTAEQRIVAVVTCSGPLAVGCGCSSGPAGLALAALAALLRGSVRPGAGRRGTQKMRPRA